MRTHRFYVEGLVNKWGPIELHNSIWLHDEKLLHQWLRVFRFREGQEVVLFNDHTERLYRITNIESDQSVHVELVTELERTVPSRHIYLLWSLLKKDKNEWVLQKATELGVRNFVPIIAERSEKLGFDIDRAKKIVIEASEQCGRSDIPDIREPLTLQTGVDEYADLPLFVAEKATTESSPLPQARLERFGILIGPEGGWSEPEKALFVERGLAHVSVAEFVLRAETAAVTALTYLQSHVTEFHI